jgi:hypothetical protein
MVLQQRIKSLEKLAQYIKSNPEEWQTVKLTAHRNNTWFISEYIEMAIENICNHFLATPELTAFVNHYTLTDNTQPKTVGVVMAGNIPLVGFHDFLCVYLSGHHIKIKLSAKDQVLLKHIILQIKTWYPELANSIEIADMLKGCDAYIATGGNNTGNYFDYYFGKYPNIIRKNRTSVAILTGQETPEELELLTKDIHSYFGFGCRNVTKLFVPNGYDFVPLINACKTYNWMENHNSWKNNYDYQLSILLLNNHYYMSSGSLLFTENEKLFSPIAQLYYSYYDNKKFLVESLQQNNGVQCLVGKGFTPFGSTQQPDIFQYADGVDTMQFLLKL